MLPLPETDAVSHRGPTCDKIYYEKETAKPVRFSDSWQTVQTMEPVEETSDSDLTVCKLSLSPAARNSCISIIVSALI